MILQNLSIAFLTRFTPRGIQVVVFKEIIDKIGVLGGKYGCLSSVVGIVVTMNAYFYSGTVNFSEKIWNLEKGVVYLQCEMRLALKSKIYIPK